MTYKAHQILLSPEAEGCVMNISKFFLEVIELFLMLVEKTAIIRFSRQGASFAGEQVFEKQSYENWSRKRSHKF